MNDNSRPTDGDAQKIAARYLGTEPLALKRFPTGLCHYVYEVSLQSGGAVVLRIGHSKTRDHLKGSIYWTERLLKLRFPIPKILHQDLSGDFPYTILERIPGQDLGEVYTSPEGPIRNAFLSLELLYHC